MNLTDSMKQEQERLNKLLADLDEKRANLDKEEETIRKELMAIDAYVNALEGKVTKKKSRTRRTGLKEKVIATLKSSDGMKRSDILNAMGAKGDKGMENSISNTLNLLKKAGKVSLTDGVYKLSEKKK